MISTVPVNIVVNIKHGPTPEQHMELVRKVSKILLDSNSNKLNRDNFQEKIMGQNSVEMPTVDTPVPDGWAESLKPGMMVVPVSNTGVCSTRQECSAMIGSICTIHSIDGPQKYWLWTADKSDFWAVAKSDLRPAPGTIAAPAPSTWPEAEFLAGDLAIVSESVQQRKDVLARLLAVLPDGKRRVFHETMRDIDTDFGFYPSLAYVTGDITGASKNYGKSQLSAADFLAATARLAPQSPHTGAKQVEATTPPLSVGPYRPLAPGETCTICGTFDYMRPQSWRCPRCGEPQRNPMMEPRRKVCHHLRLVQLFTEEVLPERDWHTGQHLVKRTMYLKCLDCREPVDGVPDDKLSRELHGPRNGSLFCTASDNAAW